MSEAQWDISYYVSENARIPFREWFEALHDYNARTVIDARLTRLNAGNFGNCQSVGEGVFEFKINYGPGYRIYFGNTSTRVILLLCGGDKSTQQKDIQIAHYYWQHFKEKHR